MRRAREDDRAAVMEFASRTWDGWDYIPRAWPHWLAATDGVLLAATAGRAEDGASPRDADGRDIPDDQPIAVARVALLSPAEAWLEGIRVDPRVRGLGVATDLQVAELRWAAASSASIVRYATGERNEASHRLGARHGFELLARFRLWQWHERPPTEDDADDDEASGFDDAARTRSNAVRRVVLEALGAAGRLARSEEADAWWARLQADAVFRAGAGLCEHRGWTVQQLDRALFDRYVATGQLITAGDPGSQRSWALATLMADAPPAEDANVKLGMLAGAGTAIAGLATQVRRLAGQPIGFWLPDAEPPSLAAARPALLQAGFHPRPWALDILARPLETEQPLPEPDEPAGLVMGDQPTRSRHRCPEPDPLLTLPGASGKVAVMPTSTLPSALRDEVAKLGSADIMVGIPSFKNAATIGYVARAAQAGLVQYFADLRPVLVNADAGSPDGTQRVVVETEPPDYIEKILLVRPRNRLRRISLTYPEVDGVGGKGAALRTIFQMADALGVEALVVVDSDLRSIIPEWIELLAGPVLKGGFDFVAPLYSRYKYDGTITNTVTYPLTRCLYGLRIRQPIGGDFGVSGDLVKHYLAQDDWDADTSKFGVDIWMTTKAISGGFAVCQTRLGAKVHDPKDPGADLGPMFSQVVSTILRLTEMHAERWLDVVTSHDVPIYGFERILEPPPLNVDAGRLLEEFAKGRLTVGDEWAVALAPENAAVINRLSAEAGEVVDATTRADAPSEVMESGFNMPDETWARVIYDMCLAYRSRLVEKDRLIASLIPIYFGRVASLIIETHSLTTDQAEAFVERQAHAFELAKPYLVDRWRKVETTSSPKGAKPRAPASARKIRVGS